MKQYDNPERDTYIDARVAELAKESEEELRDMTEFLHLSESASKEDRAEALAAYEYDEREE